MTMDRPSNTIWNVPNQITAMRLVLAIVVFVLIPLENYLLAMVLFSIAAATDWMDGYWARKYNQVTRLGRVFDPFVDKVIICGTYILLAADGNQQQFGLWGIVGWMAVVVAARELLVTVIRSQIEKEGGDFSAKWAGKWKMGFQCGAVIATLLALHLTHSSKQPMQDLADWLKWTMAGFIWLSVASTVYSGAVYVLAAGRLMHTTPDDDSSESS